MNIAKSTKIAQNQKDITSAELARRLNTSPQNVTHIRRTKNPRIKRVIELASIFDMSIDDFVGLGSDY